MENYLQSIWRQKTKIRKQDKEACLGDSNEEL